MTTISAQPQAATRFFGGKLEPSSTMLAYLLSGVAAYEIRDAISRNPTVPPALHDLIADDPARRIRYQLASNSAIDATVAAHLSTDASPSVRYRLALNPATPTNIVLNLCADADEKVALHALRSPRLTAAALDLYATSPHDSVRAAVATRTLNPATLHALSTDESELVRRATAGNENTSPETLALLARDDDFWTLARAASNSRTTAETLTALTYRCGWEIRACIARNPAADRYLLLVLSHDPHEVVRTAAELTLRFK